MLTTIETYRFRYLVNGSAKHASCNRPELCTSADEELKQKRTTCNKSSSWSERDLNSGHQIFKSSARTTWPRCASIFTGCFLWPCIISGSVTVCVQSSLASLSNHRLCHHFLHKKTQKNLELIPWNFPTSAVWRYFLQWISLLRPKRKE